MFIEIILPCVSAQGPRSTAGEVETPQAREVRPSAELERIARCWLHLNQHAPKFVQPAAFTIFVFMDYLLHVPKHKQAFLEELLKNFTFLKACKISAEKAERVNDMLDAITEMEKIVKGRRKPKSMKALLREL